MIELSNLENRNISLPCWNYYIISEKGYHIDLGEYNTYGIGVIGSNYVIHDVSTYKENAIHMATLFNQHQLSPIHLNDIIEDIILPC